MLLHGVIGDKPLTCLLPGVMMFILSYFWGLLGVVIICNLGEGFWASYFSSLDHSVEAD